MAIYVILCAMTLTQSLVQASKDCGSLASLSLAENLNTTILGSSYIPAQSDNVGDCASTFLNSVDVCCVYGVINTTSTSAVDFEVWLPDTWYGRVLTNGNGALTGCISYPSIDYATSLHFAAIGSNAGHDGITAVPFLNHPEVINDFSYRSVHATAVVGKQIVEAYYSIRPAKSYYLGCSAGGRQGIQSALLYPEDFDGILAGSPALDWNHFIGASVIQSMHLGAPNPHTSDKFIPLNLWTVITREILRQCDHLDGLVDAIITEPDDCNFVPDTLLCAEGETDGCLTKAQTDALRVLYSPLYGTHGQLLWPRFDPGSELDHSYGTPMNGQISSLASWLNYAVYNDSQFSFANYSVADIEFADTINPGGISTWNGNLSSFRNRGGKLLTFHGRSDVVVPAGNSKRFYELVSSTLSLPSLDDFYRLFMIPGMFHCEYSGAWAIGQGATAGTASNVINDTDHNILLALVDWVEGGVAPDVIIGVDDRLGERVHCRHPQKSSWTGFEWSCS